MPTIIGKFLDGRQPIIKVRLSNAIAFIDGDEYSLGPAAQREIETWALIDTGATRTIIDIELQRKLMLVQQATAQILFPNMELSETHPTYTCALLLGSHYNDAARFHEWKDWLEVVCFNLRGRAFEVVVGTDILAETKLFMSNGSVRLEY